MTDPTSIVLAGGGTAGHISPLLATAAALQRRYPGAHITCVGSHGGLEERLVPDAGFDLRLIPKVAFPRRPNTAAVRFPVAFPKAVRQARAILHDVEADVVVGFGGFVCPPVYVAARRRIPIVVHEGNAVVGMATKLGMRFTDHVVRAFDVTPLPEAPVIGMPLRRAITELDREAMRPVALEELGLADHRPTVLVTGGSLGAQQLNSAFERSVDELRAAGIQVLHVTGTGKGFAVSPGAPQEPRYVVREYCDRMDLAYAAADLVVTRSGANMVCETSACGLPAVFVPLPIGNGEQRRNADAVVTAGGAILVDNDDLTADWVQRELPALVLDSARLTTMSAAAEQHGYRDADERLVDLIATVVDEELPGGQRGR
ncbi:undecaprenyldiphospho-muramoylpentapeptide beta-N-acetylglucosaminyltransferase [Demetria terragena]|uniref:undecaprenyldiphospho-muramoylpentapeptide beta-N-acetylglucosaminyltransferase n=1 Tax=Demetria terragena TaxID=63959 RepID=UPI00036A9FBF|nr:undecaprenyldiphospho-muramoylpentapeptide beta-N-acetylglucosaminyltransferase [Demetria terragena]